MPGSTLTSHAGPGTAVHYTGSLAPGLLPLNAREFLIPLDLFFFPDGDVDIGGGWEGVGAGGIWYVCFFPSNLAVTLKLL